MCPSKVADGDERGWIVPIGGAEEKEDDPAILSRFVRLCGGKHFAHSGKAVRSDGMVMNIGADHAFSCRSGPA